MNRSSTTTTMISPLKNYYDIDSRIQQLINTAPSECLLAHIVQQAAAVIPCYHASVDTASATNFSTTSQQTNNQVPPLPSFVNLLARRSLARTGTLLATLVLLDRLRQRLSQFARGMPCTCQRIFLATLIVTTKLLHDTSPKNKHWVKYAVYFTLPEINLMESQLLALLDYRLTITEKDLYYSFLIYDNMLNFQLHQQHHNDRRPLNTTYYHRNSPSSNLSKSASCNVAYYNHEKSGGNSSSNSSNSSLSISKNYTSTTRSQRQWPNVLNHQQEHLHSHIYHQQQSRRQQQPYSVQETNYTYRYENPTTKRIPPTYSTYFKPSNNDLYYSNNNGSDSSHQDDYFLSDSNHGNSTFSTNGLKRSYHHITASTSSSSLSSSLSSNSTVDELIFTPTTATTKSNNCSYYNNNVKVSNHGFGQSTGHYNSNNNSSRNLTSGSNGSSSHFYHQSFTAGMTGGDNYNNIIKTTATVDNSTAAVGPSPHDHQMLRSKSLMWFNTVLGHHPASSAATTTSATNYYNRSPFHM